jgi:aminoglycoside phosphotransferase
MAVANDVNDEEDRVLTAVSMECEELRAKKYLEVVTTNHKLAKKYAISPRTVTNWRKESCPFEDRQWAVLDWMAERRYAPAGATAKFGKQPSERKDKAVWAQMTRKVTRP